MVACTGSPATSPTANGEEPTTYQMEINLLGTKYEVNVDSQGKTSSSVQVTSTDGTIGLSIDKNTIIHDAAEKPVSLIPPQDATIIGAVYELTPPGTTFTSPVKLTLSFNPEELPEEATEDDVYIASYADGQWQKLSYKQVDTGSHRVATQIDYFTRYAVLVAGKEIPPVPPTPDAGDNTTADRVDVVYFHRANRCYSCVYAEEQTVYTLETYFSDELSNGKITFQSVNVQDESNIALIEKYGAYTSQLFISTITGDAEHMEEVIEFWQFIGNDEGFSNLIRNKITSALEGAN